MSNVQQPSNLKGGFSDPVVVNNLTGERSVLQRNQKSFERRGHTKIGSIVLKIPMFSKLERDKGGVKILRKRAWLS